MSEQADIFAPEALAASRAAAMVPIDGNRFRLSVPGEPVAKGRPRLGIVRGHAMAFTPKATRTYESEIRHLASEAWGDRPLLDGRKLFLAIDAYRQIPKSLPKKKAAAAAFGDIRPCVKPDADNYAKSVCDALNGVVFRDDALIVELTIRKWYGDRPRLELELRW